MNSAAHTPITFVGGGNMGAALVAGLLKAGWPASLITVVESSSARREQLNILYPGITTSEKIVACTAGVIAVKPPAAVETCAALAQAGATRVLSIAAGIGLGALQSAAGTKTAVVRAMPNTPALVGEGAAGISGSNQCNESDIAWAESILGAVGTVVRIEEKLLDAVTAISGSGPAYIFLVAEALMSSAVTAGLPADVADALVRQLLVGSARLLQLSTESPAQLRANVTSPNGVTAAAIQAFEQAGIRDAIEATVQAAVSRSREMGS